MPGVFAQEQRHFAVLEVGARDRTEHAMAHPELARLLLSERARAITRTERTPRRARVHAGQVVTLPAAAVIKDAVASVRIAHARQALRDFAHGRVPVDGFEAAVAAPAQRLGQPITAVLIVIQAVWF